MIEFDLRLAEDGYLRPMADFRLVHGLESIMADVMAAGLRVVWDATAHIAGRYLDWDGVIVLATWILWRPAAWVRFILAHEVAHAYVGRSEQRVRRWMEWRYGDLGVPW